MKSFPAFRDSFNGCGLDCALLADDPKYRVEYEWLAHRQTSPNEFQVSLPLLALLWQILSGTGFPNQFFCDSWVVGFGGADHGWKDVGLERRAWTLSQAVSGSVGSQGAATNVSTLRVGADRSWRS